MKIYLKSMLLGVGLALAFVGALIFADDKNFFVNGYKWKEMEGMEGKFEQFGYIQGYQDATNFFSIKIRSAIYRASHKVKMELPKAQSDTLEKLGYEAYYTILIDSLQYPALEKLLTEVFKQYYPDGTLGQIREAIDDFYSDYRMKHIELPIAMYVIRLVLEGNTKEEIEQAKIHLIQLQRWYDELQSK